MRTVQIGDKDEISFENPGDYELLAMRLYGPPKKKLDGTIQLKAPLSLHLIYTNFSIFEDLYSNCLTASVSIIDANSILTEFPIIGDETIEIMFRSMNTEIAIHLKFRVTGISEIEKMNENTNLYTLELTSPVAIQNEKFKVSRSFGGINHKTHKIVEYVCKTYLNLKNTAAVKFRTLGDLQIREKNIEDDYYLIESESGHSEKYIAPSISPFNVINNLCRRSIDSSGSLYFFFEDVNQFRFVNIEETFIKRKKGNIVKKLICFPNDATKKTLDDIKIRWNTVIDYSIKKRFNVFENMKRGMYSSEVTFLDLEKRQHFTKKYYYQEEGAKYNHSSDGYLLTSKYSDLIHDVDNESPSTVAAIVPMHFGDSQSQDYTIHTYENFQRRMSMEAQLDGIIIEAQIPGDSTGEISVGSFVHFSFISADPNKEQGNVEDPYLSGKYMVTRIRHHLTKEDNSYSMIIEMISDTVFNEYDSREGYETSSIQTNSEQIELERDQIEVSTSARSNIIVDANHAISRKRRNMKASVTITSEERKNV